LLHPKMDDGLPSDCELDVRTASMAMTCVVLIDLSGSLHDAAGDPRWRNEVEGVIARACSGRVVDGRFFRRAADCRRAGLPLGAAAQFDPFVDGAVQATVLWDCASRTGGASFEVVKCGPWWDPASSPSARITSVAPKRYEAELASFVFEIGELSGRRPIVATTASFWNRHVQSTAFGHLDCIVARSGWGISHAAGSGGALGAPSGGSSAHRRSMAVTITELGELPGGFQSCAGWTFSIATSGPQFAFIGDQRVEVHLVREAAWWDWVTGMTAAPSVDGETVLYSTITHRRAP
jgi:hypothetical protein